MKVYKLLRILFIWDNFKRLSGSFQFGLQLSYGFWVKSWVGKGHELMFLLEQEFE